MSEDRASTASLALAVKLKKIFEKEDKYLAFPMGMGLSYRSLEFMKDPMLTSLSAQEQLNYKGEFSRLFNIIPEDKAFFPLDASRFLWDEMKRILTSCIFAQSGLTPNEEQQLSEAIDFVTDDEVGSDGSKIPVYSPQVTKYYEYKTLYDAAYGTYLDEQLSVQYAEGPEAQQLKQRWNDYREKQLREAYEKAMQDWINLGFKNQVERCMALRNQLETRKYLDSYGQAFLQDIKISEIADLNGLGVGFYTTFFSPRDIFDRNSPWINVTLTKAEINGLFREAPSDLRALFGADQGNIDIESISLEYNNVVIMRPWMKPEFFQSRCWKLPDVSVVSNGRIPRQGTLPAYITSILVVRNFKITRKTWKDQPPIVLPLLSKTTIQKMRISDLSVKEPLLRRDMRITTPPRETISGSTTLSDKSMNMLIQPRTSFVRTATISDVAMSKGAVKFDKQTMNLKEFYPVAKYQGTTILTPRTSPDVIKLRTDGDLRQPPQTDKSVTETFNLDDGNGVIVLAFVCNRLPKAPNPDPALRW